MKAKLLLLFLCVGFESFDQSANASGISAPVPISPTPASQNLSSPVVTERGPNYRVWTRTNSSSSTITNIEVVELATGMHYWDGQEWTPSDPGFQVTSNGFSASHTQHKVHLNQNIDVAGAVNVVTRDGVVLNSTPLGIGLYDA